MGEIWRHDGRGGFHADPSRADPLAANGDAPGVMPQAPSIPSDPGAFPPVPGPSGYAADASLTEATPARAQNRDSLFMQAAISALGAGGAVGFVTVRVRNLSSGGLMAEGPLTLAKGQAILVDLANVGQVRGTVAWVGGGRFGVAFDVPVDPQAVRRKVTTTRPREFDPYDVPGLRGRSALRPR